MNQVFEDIYKNNVWNGKESLSGPGSGSASTKKLAKAILALISEFNITSVFDAACGDGFWMPDLPNYEGIDVSETAIRLSKKRHPDRKYFLGDARTYSIPQVDLIIFRDTMQHMSLADGLAALKNIKRARPKYMLISSYVGGKNAGISPEAINIGLCYCPDLTKSPFSMPPPIRYIPDGGDWKNPDKVRDSTKMLGLWQ